EVAAVNLRAVPPVSLGVGVGRYGTGRTGFARRVVASAADAHRGFGPGIVVVERNLERTVLVVVAVAHPIVDLELNPRSRQQVERCRRLELASRHPLPAYGSGAW